MSLPQIGSGEPYELYNFQGSNVRIMKDDDGNLWFVAADTCRVLGYSNPSKAVADHVDDEDKGYIAQGLGIIPPITPRYTPGSTLIINESGLYALIFGSQKSEARIFKHWITHDVIPAIRKTGSYLAQPKSLAEQALIHAQALVDHERRLIEHDQRLIQLESRVQPEPNEHSIVGYCAMHRIQIDLRSAQLAGQRARKLSDARGLPVGKVSDPRFGEVNTYRDEVLDEIFQETNSDA